MRRRGERGQALALVAMVLAGILLAALLVLATSRTFDRAAEAGAAADAASLAAGLVAADSLSALAQLNGAMAHLEARLGRLLVDRVAMDTLDLFRQHPPGPAPPAWIGVDGSNGLAADARAANADALAKGERWMAELWRAGRAIAASAPARMRDAADRAARVHGGEVVALDQPVRWLPEGAGPSVLERPSWERFDRALRTRYLPPDDPRLPAWYDLPTGAARGYRQLRECWHPKDLAHGQRHGKYWPHPGRANGHWHAVHAHLVWRGNGVATVFHDDGHKDDGHIPTLDGGGTHHAILRCPTCRSRDHDGNGATDVVKTDHDVRVRYGSADLALRRPVAGAPAVWSIASGGPPMVAVEVRLPLGGLPAVFARSAPRAIHGRARCRVGLYRIAPGGRVLDVDRPRSGEWLGGTDNLYVTVWGARWVAREDE